MVLLLLFNDIFHITQITVQVIVSAHCTGHVQFYDVPFVKYVLRALYGQVYAFPILYQNGKGKRWTDFCGL